MDTDNLVVYNSVVTNVLVRSTPHSAPGRGEVYSIRLFQHIRLPFHFRQVHVEPELLTPCPARTRVNIVTSENDTSSFGDGHEVCRAFSGRYLVG